MEPLFRAVTIRGRIAGATILWGYRTAATFSSWTISKVQNRWIFRGTFADVNRLQLRQTPLDLTVPWAKGFFVFRVQEIRVGESTCAARVAPPEGA